MNEGAWYVAQTWIATVLTVWFLLNGRHWRKRTTMRLAAARRRNLVLAMLALSLASLVTPLFAVAAGTSKLVQLGAPVPVAWITMLAGVAAGVAIAVARRTAKRGATPQPVARRTAKRGATPQPVTR